MKVTGSTHVVTQITTPSSVLNTARSRSRAPPFGFADDGDMKPPLAVRGGKAPVVFDAHFSDSALRGVAEAHVDEAKVVLRLHSMPIVDRNGHVLFAPSPST
jgi:hypothetical protein